MPEGLFLSKFPLAGSVLCTVPLVVTCPGDRAHCWLLAVLGYQLS